MRSENETSATKQTVLKLCIASSKHTQTSRQFFVKCETKYRCRAQNVRIPS